MGLLSLIYGNGLETDLKRTWNGGEAKTEQRQSKGIVSASQSHHEYAKSDK